MSPGIPKSAFISGDVEKGLRFFLISPKYDIRPFSDDQGLGRLFDLSGSRNKKLVKCCGSLTVTIFYTCGQERQYQMPDLKVKLFCRQFMPLITIIN